MAVSTIYKASSEYKAPNGTIYLDGAGGKNTSSTNSASSASSSALTPTYTGSGTMGTTGSTSTSSNGVYKAKSTNYTPYTQSDEVKALKSQSQDYADQIESMSYSPSAYVTAYKNKLTDVENSKPADYVNKWAETQNSLLNDILNEKEFSYTGQDLMNDDMYKMYSEMYEKNARKAMNDAMGTAQAATGGYGSTYSQAAGQQAYDDTMSNMNSIALELADKAYEKYLNERSNRYNKLSTVNSQEQTDYNRYRDEIGDWQTDRTYYAGRYNDSYDRDYQSYRDDVSDLQYLSSLYAQLYGTDSQNELSAWTANRDADEFESEYELSKNADERAAAEEARAAEKWSYDKQLLALQLQQAQAAAAGIGTSSGGNSGGSSRRSSSSKKSSSSSSLSPVTTADITNFIQKGATAKEIKQGVAISKNWYANNSNMTAEQKAKANKVLDQYAALADRKKKSTTSSKTTTTSKKT